MIVTHKKQWHQWRARLRCCSLMSKNSPETNSQKSLRLNCGWQVHLYVCACVCVCACANVCVCVCVFASVRKSVWQWGKCVCLLKMSQRNSWGVEKHSLGSDRFTVEFINKHNHPHFLLSFYLRSVSLSLSSSLSLNSEYSIKCLVKRKIRSWTFTPFFFFWFFFWSRYAQSRSGAQSFLPFFRRLQRKKISRRATVAEWKANFQH